LRLLLLLLVVVLSPNYLWHLCVSSESLPPAQ